MRLAILTACLLATTLVPGASADDAEDGIYPCEGGYYAKVGKVETECLPGLGYTGTRSCPGRDTPGTAVWVDGRELFCMY